MLRKLIGILLPDYDEFVQEIKSFQTKPKLLSRQDVFDFVKTMDFDPRVQAHRKTKGSVEATKNHLTDYTVLWTKGGQLHRDGGPAVVSGDFEAWYQNGKLHRDNGPAVVLNTKSKPAQNEYYMQIGSRVFNYNHGRKGICKEWFENGQRHRTDGPAVVRPDGIEWFQDGKLHRDDGPALTYGQFNARELQYRKNGKPFREADQPTDFMSGTWTWRNSKGQVHRDERRGPAIIDKNGGQFWYSSGNPHRVNGPAWIVDQQQKFYLFGIECSKAKQEQAALAEKIKHQSRGLVIDKVQFRP